MSAGAAWYALVPPKAVKGVPSRANLYSKLSALFHVPSLHVSVWPTEAVDTGSPLPFTTWGGLWLAGVASATPGITAIAPNAASAARKNNRLRASISEDPPSRCGPVPRASIAHPAGEPNRDGANSQ